MAVLDNFLLSHQIDSAHFNIGGHLTPISIRDQMLRGRLIVARAIENDLIAAGRRLLIVGAGVGGITAAMYAATAGVDVTLMEQKGRPFDRHHSCGRVVNPTQYDWQLAHWDEGMLPFSGTPPMLLAWPKPDRATFLTGNWLAQYNTFKITPDGRNINERFRTKFLRAQPSPSAPGPLNVEFQELDQTGHPIGLVRDEHFHMLISAIGFGEERCFLYKTHPFRGFEFWANDPYEQAGLTWKAQSIIKKRVVISGAGDGALQDFLRIVTKKSCAFDIWKSLDLASVIGSDVLGKELRTLSDEDVHASRALHWGNCEGHDHPVLDRVHDIYQKTVEKIYNLRGVADACQAIVRDDAASIALVHPCSHFGNVYGLNRFLSNLFMLRLKESGMNVHYPKARVFDVKCNHALGSKPDSMVCDGESHVVSICPAPDCYIMTDPASYSQSTSPACTQDLDCEVVVMRHGLIPPALVRVDDPAVELSRTRQMLPYFFPGA